MIQRSATKNTGGFRQRTSFLAGKYTGAKTLVWDAGRRAVSPTAQERIRYRLSAEIQHHRQWAFTFFSHFLKGGTCLRGKNQAAVSNFFLNKLSNIHRKAWWTILKIHHKYQHHEILSSKQRTHPSAAALTVPTIWWMLSRKGIFTYPVISPGIYLENLTSYFRMFMITRSCE